MANDPFELARRKALALEGVEEAPHHDRISFRVRGRIFATFWDSPARLMVKLDPEDQANFVLMHPEQVAPVPGGWGRGGATHVTLGEASESLIETLLSMAWARAAKGPGARRGKV